jgi:hypothetical protein
MKSVKKPALSQVKSLRFVTGLGAKGLKAKRKAGLTAMLLTVKAGTSLVVVRLGKNAKNIPHVDQLPVRARKEEKARVGARKHLRGKRNEFYN